MTTISLLLAGAAFLGAAAAGAPKDDAEAVIRQRIESLASAVSAKDLDRAGSFYAPEIVSFDIVQSLRYAGADDKRRAWKEAFATYAGPIRYEVHELSVTAQGDVAFAHSLNRIGGTLANGHAADMWLRWTACFRRIGGVWLIVHDHASVPADLEHGRALVSLEP